MFLAYNELLKLEKKEKKMRSSNYFAEGWGLADSYVRSSGPNIISRYELPQRKIIKKVRTRNAPVYKSVDVGMRKKKVKSRSRSKSKNKRRSISPVRDDELERAQ